MKILVQKYGGSSVSTPQAREAAAVKIEKALSDNYSLVIVLSAMGRFPDPFATDTLIESMSFKKSRPNQERDLVLSTGENYSCITMAQLLRSKGIKTKVLSGFDAGILTDSNHSNAKIEKINPQTILTALSEGYTVLITGFQGVDEKGSITTLGRGGSDTTATALGAALKAEKVEIYTDVDGVMTADPRIYKASVIMSELDITEMGEMANEGAKVLHTRCVEIANRHAVPLYVKNTFSDHCGTCICKQENPHNIISGLIHRTGITDFVIDCSKQTDSSDFQEKLFTNMTELKVSLDLINVHREKIYFSVVNEDAEKVINYLNQANIDYKILTNVAKISCVGSGMEGIPGVMSDIYRLLTCEGIHIYRTVDSFINISFLIKESSLQRAIATLHTLCG